MIDDRAVGTRLDQAMFARLIELLEAVRPRPAMYFGSVAVEAAVHWLHGFASVVMTLDGGDGYLDAREQVLISRGWSWTAREPAEEMIERGLSPAEVVDELLAVEAEVLRRIANPRAE